MKPDYPLFFLLYIIFNQFILPWVVLTAFKIHQNSSSRDLQHGQARI